MQKILSIIFCLVIGHSMSAQITADVERGCIPLEVNFTGPTLATYFWDFGDDDGNSDQPAPSRIFDEPGIYEVELFAGAGGASQGTVTITVYADPIIQFSTVGEQDGCAPFFVEFINESIVDPAVPITSYLWAFGDGSTSTLENPTHIYNGVGTYPVTLRINSSLPECGDEMTFEGFITVTGTVPAGFTLSALEICDVPATFNITNNTPNEPLYTYNWDFGNGTNSTDRSPGSVTYTEKGNYTIRLEVDNGDGCVVTRERTVRVGGPRLELPIADTLCLLGLYDLPNNTNAAIFSWTFSEGIFPSSSTQRNPRVQFTTPGNKLVTFTATGSTGCVSDTTFTIHSQEVNPTYTVDPFATCDDPATFIVTSDQTYATYSWNGEAGDKQITVEYDAFDGYDSFHINRPDTLFYTLTAVTTAGCVGVFDSFFMFRDIEAHKVPDVSRGCAPLTVNFQQLSKSIEPIISYDWNFGDGTTLSDNTGADQSHTFDAPGEYYVKLIVENDNGCIDTSTGVWIYVGEPLTSDNTVDKQTICLYDSIALGALNLDERIDSWHFETDEGRNSHCYINPNTNHAFVTKPGIYPITLELEYNGCYNKFDAGSIEVEGAKALIQYMMNCDDTHTVMLQDSSFGATSTVWTIEGQTFNTEDQPDSILNYTFVDTGVYKIYLEAFDADSSCPSDIDSVEVHIVDVFASFAVDSINCEGPVFFDATSSIGADTRCHKGYTWYFPTNRPRRIGLPTIEQGLFEGPDPDREWDIRLEVEDINGCVDDTIISIKVYDVDADFEFDSEKICFPSELVLTDKSVSDTSIVSWVWSTGSPSDSVVTIQATGSNQDSTFGVGLTVTDAYGCTSEIFRELEVYQVTSTPTVAPNPVCIGDTITLSATDYTQDGSFLNFQWSIDNMGGSSTEQKFDVVINTPGIYNATLDIEEDASGCENTYGPILIQVVDIPQAAFTSNPPLGQDVCIGDIVEFINGSTIDGGGGYFWDFGNGAPISQVESPSIAFNTRGTFDIELIAQSSAGCADTAYAQVTTTGPEGDFMIDNDMICRQGDVTFTLVNPVGVTSFSWDFGDGETADDVNPVTHTYNLFGGTTANLRAKLILRGSIEECEIIQDIDIELNDLAASFISEIDSSYCPHRVLLTDGSSSMFTSKTITVDDGRTFESLPDVLTFEDVGTYTITQELIDENSGCSDIYSDTLVIGTNNSNPSFTLQPADGECAGTYDISESNIPAGYTVTYATGTGTAVFVRGDTIVTLPSGTTQVIQTIMNDRGCETTSTEEVQNVFEIQMPNLFSPNGDSENDILRPVVLLDQDLGDQKCIGICSFQVFDRWGNEVYSTTDLTSGGWDGLINGSIAASDMYMYIVTVHYNSDEEFDCDSADPEVVSNRATFKGNVFLMH